MDRLFKKVLVVFNRPGMIQIAPYKIGRRRNSLKKKPSASGRILKFDTTYGNLSKNMEFPESYRIKSPDAARNHLKLIGSPVKRCLNLL